MSHRPFSRLSVLALRSHTTGQWKAGSFEGTYRTTTTDGSTEVDQGTWMAARE